MGIRHRVVLLFTALALAVAPAARAQVSFTADYAYFLSNVGPVTVETFLGGAAFPLGSTLNSTSSYAPATGSDINPGDIQPGVTYAVSGGPLLIDAGGTFLGGFLIGSQFWGTIGPLMVTFDGVVAGFGFWHNNFSGNMSIDVHTADGSQNFLISEGYSFAGFLAGASKITGATISGDDSYFSFALDDFTFSAVEDPGATVPEPASMTLFATGLAGLAAARRRRREPAQ